MYVALELLPAARMDMINMCTTCQVTYKPRRNVFTEFAMRSQASQQPGQPI
jgi:hypothetical protein